MSIYMGNRLKITGNQLVFRDFFPYKTVGYQSGWEVTAQNSRNSNRMGSDCNRSEAIIGNILQDLIA